MIWLLIVIHLNLTTIPIQVQHGEVIATFPSHQACAEKHNSSTRGKADNAAL